MSFLKKLFGLGGGSSEPEQAVSSRVEDHNGFTIRATPYKEGGQWQLCGVIAKEVNGETKEHRFIRADRFASQEDAESMTFIKARQIIDQQGERVFS